MGIHKEISVPSPKRNHSSFPDPYNSKQASSALLLRMGAHTCRQHLFTYYKPACMALLLKSLWVSQVNGGALCDKSLISTCKARAVQLTPTLISRELWPLL